MDNTGKIFNIQHFSLHDGPGIRTTIFFKGCNMNCYWCHNPESISSRQQMQFFASKCIGCGACIPACPFGGIDKTALFTAECNACGKCVDVCYAQARVIAGKKYTVDQVMGEIAKDIDVYSRSGGGVTFSGGEPLLQPGFLMEILKECKKSGIHTAVETACNVKWESISGILQYTDLIFCDIKTMDEQKHIEATGRPNSLILENIKLLSSSGVKLKLRTPVIPGFNDDEKSIGDIAAFAASLSNAHTLELLPFHGICAGKYQSLGIEFLAIGIKTPTKNHIVQLKKTVTNAGVDIIGE